MLSAPLTSILTLSSALEAHLHGQPSGLPSGFWVSGLKQEGAGFPGVVWDPPSKQRPKDFVSMPAGRPALQGAQLLPLPDLSHSGSKLCSTTSHWCQFTHWSIPKPWSINHVWHLPTQEEGWGKGSCLEDQFQSGLILAQSEKILVYHAVSMTGVQMCSEAHRQGQPGVFGESL